MKLERGKTVSDGETGCRKGGARRSSIRTGQRPTWVRGDEVTRMRWRESARLTAVEEAERFHGTNFLDCLALGERHTTGVFVEAGVTNDLPRRLVSHADQGWDEFMKGGRVGQAELKQKAGKCELAEVR